VNSKRRGHAAQTRASLPVRKHCRYKATIRLCNVLTHHRHDEMAVFMEFGLMSVINAIITVCVGLVLLGGAAMTYHYREADQRLVQKAVSTARPDIAKAFNAARSDIANANASLPKWDDKNYKGLVHFVPGAAAVKK
jgi:hypothetical protein